MLREKLFHGVLAVETDWGVRYVYTSLLQRIRLLWTFRNFDVLPEAVLNRHERALIHSLCRSGKYLVNWNGRGDLSVYCIGRVERSVPRQQPLSAVFKPCVARPAAFEPRAS